MARGPGRIPSKGGKAREAKKRAGLRELAAKQREIEQQRKAERAKPTAREQPPRSRRGRATDEDYQKHFEDLPSGPRRAWPGRKPS
jgi:hypothetical protein